MKKIMMYLWMILFVVFSGLAYNSFALEFEFISFDNPDAAIGNTQAYDINNNGQIVGWYDDNTGPYHGFVKDGDTYTSFSFPDTTSNTSASGINDLGQIVGHYYDSTIDQHSFIKNGDTFTSFDFPDPTSNDPSAKGINNNGQIVGSYTTSPFISHGFIKDGDEIISFDFPESSGTIAQDINDLGQIVGVFSFEHVGGWRSFIKDGDTYTTFDVPGSTYTYATGINNYGQIVGHYNTGSASRSFFWDGDTFTTFDFPGTYGDTNAYGINDFGQIVGVYYDNNRISHSFLATPIPETAPVPEPATMLLLGSGIVGLAGFRRKFKKS